MALKSVLKARNLSVQMVEDTMDQLTDILADHAEIDQAMSLGNETILSQSQIGHEILQDNFDKSIEKELDSLLEQESLREEELLKNLPAVQKDLPDLQEELEKLSLIDKEEQKEDASTDEIKVPLLSA